MVMRFFDHEASARVRIRRLTLLFVFLAIPATVIGVHLALSVPWILARWLLHEPLGYPLAFMPVNIGVAVALILGGWWIERSNVAAGGVHLAEKLGARPAQPAIRFEEERLVNIVREMCIASNMPRPTVMVLPQHDGINAFASGFAPGDWAITVSDGALRYLTRAELQGLAAHECSHLREGDTELNMHLIGMVAGLEMIWGFGASLRPDSGDEDGTESSAPLGEIGWVFGSLIMAAGYAGWLAARALQAAVSRQCEYLADARAVQWTRSDSLGRVLRKLLTQQRDTGPANPSRLPRRIAHLCLAPENRSGSARRPWLASHPPLAQRIRIIYGHSAGALPLEEIDARSGATTVAPTAGTGQQMPK